MNVKGDQQISFNGIDNESITRTSDFGKLEASLEL